ncbi:hypothetical protein FHS29_007132 [Saccharothrix tamanrassetensis]|uniref:Uncharacterized protein n=1 Tax=Saccharothrix tamanrassetensis TaxID=1051531 RepID=A0A841CWL2_9PSEU|nr:hypothetical protein [Saccharothrix tamanrassetensis]
MVLDYVGADVIVTGDFRAALECDGPVVPGDGAFAACVEGLSGVHGERNIGWQGLQPASSVRATSPTVPSATRNAVGRTSAKHRPGTTSLLCAHEGGRGDDRLGYRNKGRTRDEAENSISGYIDRFYNVDVHGYATAGAPLSPGEL